MGSWKSREKKDASKSKKANMKQIKETSFPKFHEYLASSGKTVEKPSVEKVADYKGPRPTSPQKSGAWLEDAERKGRKKGVGSPAPYSAPGSDPGQKKGEHGFGDEGSKELVYNPGTEVSGKEMEKGSWPKNTKIETFISATKDMPTKEFTNFMKERTINGGLEYEAIRYIATNPITLNALVREVRRKGNLETLLEALLEIPDTHKLLVESLADNPRFQKALSRAIDDSVVEAVGPPMHKDDEDEDEDMGPTPRPGAHDSLDDMEPEDDEDDEDHDEDDEDDEEDHDDHDHEDHPDMDMDMDDDEDEDDSPIPDMGVPRHKKHVSPELADKIRKMMRSM